MNPCVTNQVKNPSDEVADKIISFPQNKTPVDHSKNIWKLITG